MFEKSKVLERAAAGLRRGQIKCKRGAVLRRETTTILKQVGRLTPERGGGVEEREGVGIRGEEGREAAERGCWWEVEEEVVSSKLEHDSTCNLLSQYGNLQNPSAPYPW